MRVWSLRRRRVQINTGFFHRVFSCTRKPFLRAVKTAIFVHWIILRRHDNWLNFFTLTLHDGVIEVFLWCDDKILKKNWRDQLCDLFEVWMCEISSRISTYSRVNLINIIAFQFYFPLPHSMKEEFHMKSIQAMVIKKLIISLMTCLGKIIFLGWIIYYVFN